ncbi:hypothetical protein BBJ29_008565 [Phytophthora kernoviae]|uniref:EF-hand domain-containing protein n=1 Tax=Phytophthora kernoviae TaxID=325452 RepID=A0A3F2RF51_9STRA|nr:hypothetical protein BBJ29_008565 [Phytophthora kernoviae]RLN55339.1 hypothetical protein BBP00_00008535 [Phytophthora kernoviae]
MNIVQASFQASFDSRVDRLSEADLDDLRVIFRYFDTDGDGAVAADQACRMFALLGLAVNAAQVHELGEVYLNEFMKIVDSHVVQPPPMASASPDGDMAEAVGHPTVTEGEAASDQNALPGVDEDGIMQYNDKALEDEWGLVDTYRRGLVSMQELQQFLANCRSTISEDDLVRFLETYGTTTEQDEGEELKLTKEGFLKFRHEYSRKKIVLSDDDFSSDTDEEEGALSNGTSPQQHPDPTTPPSMSSLVNDGVSDGTALRTQSRHAGRGPSDDACSSSGHTLSKEDAFVINPDELVESDESDEEATTQHG